MKKIEIEGEFIKLDQFLKFVNEAESGGHAKMMIQSGMVKVNGEIESQRGKKLRDQDKVEVNGASYIICQKP